ncbi:MAG: hypothetical protein GXP26_08345 [Planctomycetes bacterium]|nr:hypothetical protein [Planctomycetota bacterium]
MHTSKTAIETIKLLWINYEASYRIDLDLMPKETRENYAEQGLSDRPFKVATWLTRLSFFVTAWSLWEYYAVNFCLEQEQSATEGPKRATVKWVGEWLEKNEIAFSNREWFVSANALRILIVHYGARVDVPRAKELLEKSKKAFSDIGTWQDRYVDLTHCQVADLKKQIEKFIEKVSGVSPNYGESPWQPSNRGGRG